MKITGVTSNMPIQPKQTSSHRTVSKESFGDKSQVVADTGYVETTSVGMEDSAVPITTEMDHQLREDEESQLMKKSIDQANQSLKLYDRKLELSVHEVTKAIMYTLRDTKTNDIIAEFPPKKIQDMIAKMWELAGLFVDKKA